MSETQERKGGRKKGCSKFGGRKKGSQNVVTKALKEAILAALDEVGGQKYLVKVARDDPKTFCSLLGKVLPLQVTGEGDGPLVVEIVKFADQAAE